MDNFKIINEKLDRFIRKYYTNELIKGGILFFATGLLYFLVTLIVEYYFWLSQAGRTVLFWTFIIVEFGLFARFIVYPITKLFKLQKGIDHMEASRIIGKHFPEVNDKLINVLQLKNNPAQTELLLAGIEQKSIQLQPIPFTNAVNFKANLKYLKYAAIPILVFIAFSLSGIDFFSSSYQRVINYNVAYEPPAPFAFFVINEDLIALENKPFVLNVRVAGDVMPENASILYNGESYYLQKSENGEFKYTFTQPTDNLSFKLQANSVTSSPYTLEVVPVPSLISFEMELIYPRYTGKRNELLKSTGNATVPEGTKVTWKMKTKQTDAVSLKTAESIYNFEKDISQFKLSRGIFSNLDYEITTSNARLKDYENLAFSLRAIKDQHPHINVESRQDTVNKQTTYFMGRVSDDYGFTRLQLVYYPDGEEADKKSENLPVSSSNFDQFVYAFPGNLQLTPGTTYSYYFEIFDNDAVNSPKSSRSTTFSYRKLTQEELEKQQLKEQQENIQGMDNSLKNMDKQKKELDELSRTQKEKSELNWNDKQKLENFLQRQKQQEEMMKNFSDKMKENLENFQKDKKEEDPFKENLKDRFKENEKKIEENEKLLDELEKLQDKIKKEELMEKLEKLNKNNKNQQRNLEQLLELTKRYYVEKKAQKLAEELNKLSEEQEKLSEKSGEENTKEKQENLNEKFNDFMEDMKELHEENKNLQKPMDIPDTESEEKEVQDSQEGATEDLEKGEQGEAKKQQKKAAQKMMEMGKQMQSQMASSGSEGEEEDAAMLRQVLDNLVIFSLSQEGLMEDFKIINYENPLFGQKLVRQNELKQNFQHIDDSLFALAMRNPMINTVINDLITDVQYNVDKSMEHLSDNEMRNGIANQQYTVTAANDLAVLLSDALNNMQMSMGEGAGKSGKGQGKGKGFQLPDIIEQQDSLNEKMKKGSKSGDEGSDGDEGEGEGEGDGEGEGEGQGGDGDGNEQGEDGKDGGEGQMNGEEMNGLLYEIYQQQQMLRMQLEDKLREEGLPPDARELIRRMEHVEQELLEKGFNNQTLKKMNDIKHQLMKLDKAVFQQGEEEKRQAETNKREYINTSGEQLNKAREYFNNVEILNRQSLPLRPSYKQRVQDYFKTTND